LGDPAGEPLQLFGSLVELLAQPFEPRPQLVHLPGPDGQLADLLGRESAGESGGRKRLLPAASGRGQIGLRLLHVRGRVLGLPAGRLALGVERHQLLQRSQLPLGSPQPALHCPRAARQLAVQGVALLLGLRGLGPKHVELPTAVLHLPGIGPLVDELDHDRPYRGRQAQNGHGPAERAEQRAGGEELPCLQ